jgi:hypothetical protein
MSCRENHKIKVRIPWLLEANATGWLGIGALIVIVMVLIIVARLV